MGAISRRFAAGVAIVSGITFIFIAEMHRHTQRPVVSVSAPTGDAGGAGTAVAKITEALKPCPSEAYSAVSEKLYPELDISYDSAMPEVLSRLARIKCIQDWSGTLTDPCQRTAYKEALTYYESEAIRRKTALESEPSETAERAKRQAEYRERQLKVDAYEKAHPIPTPPRCDLDLIRRVK
jgi:hypothetical protein